MASLKLEGTIELKHTAKSERLMRFVELSKELADLVPDYLSAERDALTGAIDHHVGEMITVNFGKKDTDNAET